MAIMLDAHGEEAVKRKVPEWKDLTFDEIKRLWARLNCIDKGYLTVREKEIISDLKLPSSAQVRALIVDQIRIVLQGEKGKG